MADKDRELKEVAYYVIKIGNKEIREVLASARTPYLEQCEIRDFVKYVCNIFDENGYFTSTTVPPLGKDKKFWGINKYKVIDCLIVAEMPSLCNDEIIKSRCVQTSMCNPRFDYSTGEDRDAENDFPARLLASMEA